MYVTIGLFQTSYTCPAGRDVTRRLLSEVLPAPPRMGTSCHSRGTSRGALMEAAADTAQISR